MVFTIGNHHKCLSQLFPLHYIYFYSYSAEIDNRRQILPSKVDPRAVRVNPLTADVAYILVFIFY